MRADEEKGLKNGLKGMITEAALREAAQRGTAPIGNIDGWSLQLKFIRCGKSSCKKCPHGPYLYGFRREGKKVISKYFGVIK
ncbi:MAG: hypothetical protein QXT58_02610 [Archaeoglobaceae archaeon]